MDSGNNHLTLRKLGIDSYTENIVYMRFDCPLCLSEGFKAETRVVVRSGENSIIATLNVITSELLYPEEASLSDIGFLRLGASDGDTVQITHLEPIESLASVRSKIYGNELGADAYFSIIHDISNGKYSDIQLSAFVTACSGEGRMKSEEIVSLTRAMISTGEIIKWPEKIIADKHCIGGIPGNRTTPIVVPIIAAAGLCIPKTSSRAITSPAGTADVMEVMTKVDLGIEEMQKVVAKEGGCLAWGGAVKLSPADDILIQVERALNVDSEAQLIASVLSKKAAAGATHAVIDIPVGPTAKVRTWESAQLLKKEFENVGNANDINLKIIFTDGSQPIGRGIGPSLEAMDILSVLRKCGKSSVIHTIIFIHCDHGCCNHGDYDVICLSMFVVLFIEGKGDKCTSKQSSDTVVSEPRVGKGDNAHIHLSVFMSRRAVVFSLFARYFLVPQSHRTVQRTCFRVGIRI